MARGRGHDTAGAQEAASAILGRFAARADGAASITLQGVARNGDKAQEVVKLIDEDEDIFTLVLAAGTGPKNLARRFPVSAVPRGLSDPGHHPAGTSRR
jgi:hypothetical protein